MENIMREEREQRGIKRYSGQEDTDADTDIEETFGYEDCCFNPPVKVKRETAAPGEGGRAYIINTSYRSLYAQDGDYVDSIRVNYKQYNKYFIKSFKLSQDGGSGAPLLPDAPAHSSVYQSKIKQIETEMYRYFNSHNSTSYSVV